MQSSQSLHSLVLSLITFGLSSGLTWLMVQNLWVAIFIGLLTVVFSAASALIAVKKHLQLEKLFRNSLRNQIQHLEREENQLYQSLYETSATKEQLEASIQALNEECRQLINRVSELHQQRNLLYQDILTIQQEKEQHESSFQRIQQQTKLIEQNKTEIKHSLELTKTQLQQLKNHVNSLQIDAERLQLEILDRKERYDLLKTELFVLEQEKRSHQNSIANLQQNIDDLLQRRSQLNLEIKNNQIASPQLNPTYLLAPAPEESDRDGDDIVSVSMALPQEWLDWLEFAKQLNGDDQITFKAILEQDEATLKQLADERATMPQVLIESLNETALNLIGDTLFVAGESALIPTVHDEYAKLLLNPIKLEFKDFLKLQENREESHH